MTLGLVGFFGWGKEEKIMMVMQKLKKMEETLR